ncbi:MAG: hypothetical protein NW241_01750 [Bacteroidia bacterium]|nr:hypothetical protein [Bacteroidia bacterium]
MMRLLDGLTPDFLKRWDHALLIRRPGLWSTRLHYVLVYGGAFSALLLIYSLFRPLSTRSVPDMPLETTLSFLPAAAGVLIWIFFRAQFQIRNGYGQLRFADLLRDQAAVLAVLLLMGMTPLVSFRITQYRIAQLTSREEIRQDYGILNRGHVYLQGLRGTDDHHTYMAYPEGPQGYTHEEIIEMVRHAHAAERREHLEAYVAAVSKYTDDRFPFSVGTIEQQFLARIDMTSDDAIEEISDESADNLRRIASAHSDVAGSPSMLAYLTRISRDNFSGLVLAFTFLWLVIMTALQTPWKVLAAALLGSGALSLVSVMVYVLASEIVSFGSKEDEAATFLAFTAYGLVLFMAFRRSNSRLLNFWKTASLSAAVLATPAMVLVFFAQTEDFFRSRADEFTGPLFMLLTAAAAVLAWNVFFQRRYLRLMAAPRDN